MFFYFLTLMVCMDANQFRQRFYDQLQGHALWRHPFFDVVESRPSQRLLEDWAIQAGKIDEVFASVLENMITNPVLPQEMAPPLIRNRDDELGEESRYISHFSYFEQLLGAIPVSRQRYLQHPSKSFWLRMTHHDEVIRD